jgi:hypothetical protein
VLSHARVLLQQLPIKLVLLLQVDTCTGPNAGRHTSRSGWQRHQAVHGQQLCQGDTCDTNC